MDKLFFASVVARERKDEISKELAIRHMLKEADGDMPQMTEPKPVVLRTAPALILFILILLYFLG